MQVFKLYMKVLNKYKGQIIMYVGIFAGLMFGFIIPNFEKSGPSQFTESKAKYAIFDYDNSELSKHIGEYLDANHELVELKEDDTEIIQDAMYNQKVYCVIRILDGYEEAFLEGNGGEKLETYKIEGLVGGMLLEEELGSYLNIINTYNVTGFTITESIEMAKQVSEIEVEVTLPQGEKLEGATVASQYFTYQPWMFIGMCIGGITPVLILLNKKNVRDRIQCSSYKFSKMNMEIILGVLVTGIGICITFAVAGVITFGGELSPIQSTLFIANMFCFMAVALSIAFLVGKITTKDQIVSLLSNVISLGMSFLSGVFVPLEYLNDTVIKIAHFLPAYWYELAVADINNYKSDKLGTILGYMGIQILFAVAIMVVGLIVARKKMTYKTA